MDSTAQKRLERLIGWTLHVLVLSAGAADAWTYRHQMNPDGMSYLDLADRFASADWSAALNGYWSPLYPMIVGAAFRLRRPGPADEFGLVHAINFGCYVAAYLAFLWFLRTLDQSRELSPIGPSRFVWRGVATALFVWATLGLAPPQFVSPDLLAVGLVLLTAAVFNHLRQAQATLRAYALFGALLALGYLDRFAFLPLIPCWLIAGWLTLKARPQARRGLAVAALVCVAGCTPLVLGLSLDRGRLTFGDTGRLNYAWYVNGARASHATLGPPGAELRHPVRLLMPDPPLYEFAAPVVATYPVWAAPAYWQDGLRPHFDLVAQFRVLRHFAKVYWMLFAPVLAAGTGLLLCAGGRRARATLSAAAPIAGVCLAALAMYALVHTERRLAAPFAPLLALSFAANLKLPRQIPAPRALVGLVVAAMTLMGACGSANFICGTGLTTHGFFVAATVVLAAVLAVQTWWAPRWPGVAAVSLLAAAGVCVAVVESTAVAGLIVLGLSLATMQTTRASSLPAGPVVACVAMWVAAVLVAPLAAVTAHELTPSALEKAATHPALETARQLASLGVQPGDQVALVGDGLQAYWARLARVRIVAEIGHSDATRFWSADSSRQAQVLEAMRRAGARGLVAERPDSGSLPPGWVRVDDAHVFQRLGDKES